MKYLPLLLLMFCSNSFSDEERIYMLGKVKIKGTTHTQLVLFYDKAINNMNDCQREIQRGVRGQWRYHHHKFKQPKGYSQRVDYYCVKSPAKAAAWYQKAKYDFVYKVDIRNINMRLTAQKSYAECLHNVRREANKETSKFFCANVSQSIK